MKRFLSGLLVLSLVISIFVSFGSVSFAQKIDPQLRGQRWNANEIQAMLMWCHDLGNSNCYTSEAIAAPEWSRWYTTEGKEGEEPPAWAKKAWELDKKRWESVTGSKEYNKLWAEGIAWHKQYLPIIPITKVTGPIIVSARMGNVPRSGRV